MSGPYTKAVANLMAKAESFELLAHLYPEKREHYLYHAQLHLECAVMYEDLDKCFAKPIPRRDYASAL